MLLTFCWHTLAIAHMITLNYLVLTDTDHRSIGGRAFATGWQSVSWPYAAPAEFIRRIQVPSCRPPPSQHLRSKQKRNLRNDRKTTVAVQLAKCKRGRDSAWGQLFIRGNRRHMALARLGRSYK